MTDILGLKKYEKKIINKLIDEQKSDKVLETFVQEALSLEKYIRCYIYANDFCPGDNLGQSAKAEAIVEIRRALASLDKLRGGKCDIDSLIKQEYSDNPNWKRGL